MRETVRKMTVSSAGDYERHVDLLEGPSLGQLAC